MKDWWVWSSPNLVDWELESIVDPKATLMWSTAGEQDECWATDAAFTNNKYYFYLSVGPGTVGVLSSDHYTGPWTDPLGKPLLDGKSEAGATFRDPCVFKEDDGSHYIIAGVFDYYIAKLGADMISLAEPLRKVIVNHPYGPCGFNRTDDKPFIHKNNGIYYLSWGCFYGMSKSIYGPYETQGAVINTTMIAPAFRMNDSSVLEPGITVDDMFASRVQQRLGGSSIASPTSNAGSPPESKPYTKPWYAHEDYTDRHGSFLNHLGQWYYASNDRSHSLDKKNPGVFRDTVICYIHFRSDGTMEPCSIDHTGVGTHDVRNGFIEAEEYGAIVGGSKLDLRPLMLPDGNDGFAINVGDGSEVRFPQIAGIAKNAATTLRLKIANEGVAIRLTVATYTGNVLGSCMLPSTAGSNDFQWIECATFTASADKLDLVFAFASESDVGNGGQIRLDKFELA